MTGKIIPYIFIGYIQITLILLLGMWLFDVPGCGGELTDFYLGAGVFVISILSLGLLISTAARDAVPGLSDDLHDFSAAVAAVRVHVSLRGHAPGGSGH